jgi:hypothetical protein
MFFTETPPERTIRDVSKTTAVACRDHDGVRAAEPVNTRSGNMTSVLTTCNDGTVKQVSPDLPNPEYAEYQKRNIVLGNEGLLIFIIAGSVILMIGGVFGVALLLVALSWKTM